MKKLVCLLFLVLFTFGYLEISYSKPVLADEQCTTFYNPFPVLIGQTTKVTFPQIFSKYPTNIYFLFGDKAHPSMLPKIQQIGTSMDGTITIPGDKITSNKYYNFWVTDSPTPIQYSQQENQIKCQGSVYVSFDSGTCGLQTDGRTIDDNQNNCAKNYHPVAYPSDEMGSVASCACQADSSNNGTSGVGFGALNLCKGTNIKGVDTPLGCFQSDPGMVVNTLLKIAFGIAGGIAILLIMIGGFKVATSQGDPDALLDGRNMITAAIIGLVFILLATVILSIIGIDILRISFFQANPGGGITISK